MTPWEQRLQVVRGFLILLVVLICAFLWCSLLSFDPADRHFVFCDSHHRDHVLRRLPAKALGVEDLTGLAVWPVGLVPQQLPLPFCFAEGQIVNELTRV